MVIINLKKNLAALGHKLPEYSVNIPIPPAYNISIFYIKDLIILEEKKKVKVPDNESKKEKKKGDLDDFIFCHEFVKDKSER